MKLNWTFSTFAQKKISLKMLFKGNFLLTKKNSKFSDFLKSENLELNFILNSFFSFLTRSYLLHNMLHLGNSKKTLNFSYKDYLLLLYNNNFIINLITLQISLK